jgi:general secretion pathway protein B
MPVEVRRELALSIGGSIYSDDPRSRFLILNGQVLHEGDRLMPGVVLEKIRLKSAVLNVRGTRYSLGY